MWTKNIQAKLSLKDILPQKSLKRHRYNIDKAYFLGGRILMLAVTSFPMVPANVLKYCLHNKIYVV